MLSLHSIQITVNNITLIKNLSISFLPSSIIHLKGPNGSGKTSLLQVIAGIKLPNNGVITVNKKNIPIINIKKPYCTYIGHNIGIKYNLTVYENLYFWSLIYNTKELLDATIKYFNLLQIMHSKCYELSAGTIKKIALAQLFICYSDLWLLDEIDSNLDQNNRKLLTNIILTKASNGGIILFSSHNHNSNYTNTTTLDITNY